MNVDSYLAPPSELSWLSEAMEADETLNETSPIRVQAGEVCDKRDVKGPQWHPYCELTIVTEGEGFAYVENEKVRQRAGELLLLGPGIPHWGRVETFPFKTITIYFLPLVLIEVGSQYDGIRILQRFTARQSGHERAVYPPCSMFKEIVTVGDEIVGEFGKAGFGREAKLRILLMELLVTVLRWEESAGKLIINSELNADWRTIMRALQFMREHYTEQIYAREISRAAGVGQSNLKAAFHRVLRLSWVKYLQAYRVKRAAALLNEAGCNATDAAFAVGFDSISHFSTTFRSLMGVSPGNYRKHVAATPKLSKKRY